MELHGDGGDDGTSVKGIDVLFQSTVHSKIIKFVCLFRKSIGRELFHKGIKKKVTELLDFANIIKCSECDCSENWGSL